VAGLDFLSLLHDEVGAMTQALASADPGAEVASCPGWTVRDLASHLIGVHTWVTATVGQPKPGAYAEEPVEGDAQQVADAYATAGQALLATLDQVPADTPSWSFDDTNHTAGYWHRRQLHEVSVHRWDVAPYAMQAPVAADGIDEAIDFFVPRMVARGQATLPPGTLRLVSPERSWTIGGGEPEVVAEGSAPDLLLSLWGRRDLIPSPWRDAKLMP
jgi:uncharacterized protein (TIGR03083 family)